VPANVLGVSLHAEVDASVGLVRPVWEVGDNDGGRIEPRTNKPISPVVRSVVGANVPPLNNRASIHGLHSRWCRCRSPGRRGFAGATSPRPRAFRDTVASWVAPERLSRPARINDESLEYEIALRFVAVHNMLTL
jgi:hypothetical protein